MPTERQLATEEQIVDWCAAAVAGDATALEALLATHHSRFCGFALRKIGLEWRSKIEVEDLLQEAYADAFTHLGAFECRGAEAFYRWMTQIIENRFLDRVRHWRRKKRDAAREATRASADSYASLAEQCRPATDSPSRALGRDEAVGIMLGCMAQLGADYGLVVRRVFLEQQDYETVATEIGRSSEAVRRMAGRALEKLRACMGRASLYLSRVS